MFQEAEHRFVIYRDTRLGEGISICEVSSFQTGSEITLSLINKDTIAAQATAAENKRVLELLHDKVSASAFVCPEKTWVLGVIDSFRAQPEENQS